MEKYNKYKDSGIEWIGKIPEHWEVRRLKDVIKVSQGLQISRSERFHKPRENSVKYITIPSIQGKVEEYIYKPSKNVLCTKEEMLVVRTGSGVGKILTNIEGAFHNNFFKAKNYKIIASKFCYFLLTSYNSQFLMRSYAGLTAIPDLNHSDFYSIFFTLPEYKEQTQIANYLDAKTAAIDKKVNLLQQKIKHYKAYRKTLINETVTKGLDKTIKLKDSGINWIGDIPEHWEVKRIKDIFNTLAGGTPSTKEKSFWIGDIPWIPSGAVQNGEVNDNIIKSYISEEALLKTSTKMARKDSILIALTGATCSNIGYLNFDTTINQSIVSIDSNKKYTSHRYYFYFLISAKEKIRTLMTGGAQGGINQGDVKYFKVCFTSKKEQQQIADYLDNKTTSIDNIVKNIETQIITLKELRKTLINEVVTGKVKVSA